MKGALLCGGTSSRMGRDKATLPLGGRPMGLWVTDAMRAGGLSEIVALGETTLPLEVIADERPHSGPLGALIGAVEALGEVFVAPCDAPQLTGSLVRTITRVASEKPEADAVLALTSRIEPLLGIYRPSALSALRALAACDRASAGPRHALGQLDVAEVGVGELLNVNTEHDLAAVERSLVSTTGASA